MRQSPQGLSFLEQQADRILDSLWGYTRRQTTTAHDRDIITSLLLSYAVRLKSQDEQVQTYKQYVREYEDYTQAVEGFTETLLKCR